MLYGMSQQTDATPVIRRSRIACKACHQRRVKCDAADGIPCMHCRTRNTTCELIESRRGRYIRQKPSKPHHRPMRNRSGPVANPSDDSVSLPDTTIHVSTLEENSATQVPLVTVTESVPAQDAPDKRSCPSDNSLTLSSIIQMVRRAKESGSGHFHINEQESIPLVDKVSLQSEPDLGGPLSLQDALIMPDPRVSDQLIVSFFTNFHPAYPVIDRLSFIDLYKQGHASPLLLHVIYMTALTCGPESLVQLAGHYDRTSARKAHYLCAKTLYDAGHEKDATHLTAALHLLSFWWLGPSDQKDSWYWHGCAVTLAQSLGMHRSLAQRGMSPRLTSIWKRVWWSIYVRDRHSAAALGRPCRIRDEDCDIEPLNESDLHVDSVHEGELLPLQEPYHVAYFLEITRLSVILGNIVIGEFSPHRPALEKFDATSSLNKLRSWRSELPQMLVNEFSGRPTGASFWASMLDVSYQNALILLFRPKATECQTFPEEERQLQARKAADTITRTAEDLLAAEMMHFAQLHLVPSLFSALSIHTLAISQKNAIHRQLAENKSRQCILALTELAKIWPVGMWVVKSFSNLLRRLLSRGSLSSQEPQPYIPSGDGPENGDNSAPHSQPNIALGEPLLAVEPHTEPGPRTPIPERDVSNTTDEFLLGSLSSGAPTAQFFQPHAYPDYFLGTMDQSEYDSAWYDSLENMLDVELLQKELGMGSSGGSLSLGSHKVGTDGEHH
ncbi:hypothetical protein AU210_014725 [Fusarium oxysporum f. sp. radicis-cucumerinum]|uniref:Zn(2)-C6 fungal-type domain-containing protein n=1 Tax=Fusarium oxysporum f. sp. radicis-cucumerinum TaxID=327505 RepID=A0A2H3GFE3_FUSOX|nr:hypothetical protein AU210_014725 [Fusarium oxysporum f. sp. radicis-cucumerinum]